MKKQTATGFLAALLIGIILGGVPFFIISSTGDRIVQSSEAELRSVQETNRQIEKWNRDAQLWNHAEARPMKLTPEQEAIAREAAKIVSPYIGLQDEVFVTISDAIARAVEPVQRVSDNWNRDRQHLAEVNAELQVRLQAQSEDTARLQSLVRGLATWLQGSLNCPAHEWEPDQHDAAQSLIDEARKERK